MAGAYRIYLINGIWKRYHVILSKLGLIIASLGYMVLAADLMLHSQYEGALKDFIFVYAFGLITFHFEIYAKITDVDGTTNLKYHYMIIK